MGNLLVIPELVRTEVIIDKYGKQVVERYFRCPDGQIREFIVWGGTVVPSIILPITKDGKVVALKQFRYAANEFVIELPGGCPERGEGFEETAKKELLEETGYVAQTVVRLIESTIWFEPAACLTPYVPLLALGCQKKQEPHPDSTEVLKVLLFNLSEWISMILKGEVRDSKTITTTFLALPHLGYKLSKL